jgi:hypothetical protein|tara:strand:+ start:8544 stop:8957 length:414 start_codon:yes stop_codon:yes gene_type:complete
MELKLKRVADNEDATFGVLINGNIPFAVTLEPAWEDNKKGISCIPSGPYSCKRVKSPKFGDTFEILDVEERTHILFHKGNSERNTQGCVLIAEEFGRLNGKAAVLASGRGFTEFMSILKEVDEFELIIEDNHECCKH